MDMWPYSSSGFPSDILSDRSQQLVNSREDDLKSLAQNGFRAATFWLWAAMKLSNARPEGVTQLQASKASVEQLMPHWWA